MTNNAQTNDNTQKEKSSKDKQEEPKADVKLVVLGNSWGISSDGNIETALSNALVHYRSEHMKDVEKLPMWTADVSKDFTVDYMGQVRAKKIENEETIEVNKELLEWIGLVVEDLEYVMERLLCGKTKDDLDYIQVLRKEKVPKY